MPATEPKKFADLFNNPSVEGMYGLTPREFEHFVAYVFRRAGYDVTEVGPHFVHGVDLEVRLPGKNRIFAGVECKRLNPDTHVKASVVTHVKGAAAVSKPNTKPFVITTSDFNDAAHQVANAGAKHAYLINGAQLVRYIRYVQGSRYDGDDVITSLSPEFFAGKHSVSARGAGETKVLAIANNKGGVGKTTTAYYLGVELAKQGQRVLLIDLDAQANLTERCLIQFLLQHTGDEHFPNIAQYFAGDHALSDLIIASETPGMSLIPSDPFLTLRDLGGSGRPEVELRFARDIQKLCVQPVASLGGVPNWIIIDTPPAMSLFTRAALAAAQFVLAPIRPRPASFRGTANMIRTLQTMNTLMGTDGALLGAVVTHWDGLVLSQAFLTQGGGLPQLLQAGGGHVFNTMIPVDNQLETLKPGAKTKGAQAYEALAAEVMNVVEGVEKHG